MGYQFHCPGGCLLEAEPAHAGMESTCPICGQAMVIPPPPGGENAQAGMHAVPQPQHQSHGGQGFGDPFSGDQSGFKLPPGVELPPQPVQESVGPPADNFLQAPETAIFHIPCPNGHRLEVPEEMLNHDVMCPHCEVQFRLRRRDSEEHQRQQEQEQERREHKAAELWLKITVGIAALVVIGLIALIVATTMG